MPPGAMHVHPIEVLRAAPTGDVDEWLQPTYEADAVVMTGRARIQPVTMTEVAALNDAGAQIGDFQAFTLLEGILPSDRIRRTDTGAVLEIKSILDFGADRELLLRQVVN